jgi:hypothetical protein
MSNALGEHVSFITYLLRPRETACFVAPGLLFPEVSVNKCFIIYSSKCQVSLIYLVFRLYLLLLTGSPSPKHAVNMTFCGLARDAVLSNWQAGKLDVDPCYIINNYWMRLSMISRIIQTEVNVICRSEAEADNIDRGLNNS